MGSRGQRRLRGVLIVAEIAAAMVLLVGSSLLIRTFLRLAAADLGFDPKGVLTLKVAPSPRTYPDPRKEDHPLRPDHCECTRDSRCPNGRHRRRTAINRKRRRSRGIF